MARPKDKKNIQTGRSLTHRYSSYSPVQKTAPSPHPQLEETAKQLKNPRRRTAGRFAAIFFCLLIITAVAIGAWDVRNISAASQKMFGSGNVFDLLSRAPLKGSGSGRINILLVGYSVDDPGHPAANLTDSIILLSMSTSSHTGYLLSIPRDLYVKIPGYGYGKINEVYRDGGAGLLEQVITDNFQTPVNYYALINYASVRDTVNALGGISVNISSSDPRGLFDPNISPQDGGPLKLSTGPQMLDGQTALNLTRARGDPCGCGQYAYGFDQNDFDRTQHQRQVLTAVKAKLSWKLILNPARNQKILNAVSQNIRTDIKATEVRSIFGIFNSIPNSSLQSVSLRNLNGRNYLSGYTTFYGQSALVPADGLNDYSSIRTAVSELNR